MKKSGKSISLANMSLLNRIITKLMVAHGYLSIHRMNRAEHKGFEINERLLISIVRHNRNCEFGKAHGFKDIHSIEEFRSKVQLSEYKDYNQDISRMEQGQRNILTSYTVRSFSMTSGSAGKPKHIPCTQEHINVYIRYTLTRALALADMRYREQYKRPLPAGKIFGALCSESRIENNIHYSNVADLAARNLKLIFPYILTFPLRMLLPLEGNAFIYCYARFGLADADVIYFFTVFLSDCVYLIDYIGKNKEMLLRDIEEGTIDESIDLKPAIRKKLEKKIKPLPERAAFLREQFKKGADSGIVSRLWPKIQVYSAIGTASFAPYKNIVNTYADNVCHDNLIYGASEGLFAASDSLNSNRYLLLVDSCFYEFIPEEDENAEPLLLNQLETGREYEIVITNHAGLYRYRIGDIVRVLGYKGETPYIEFLRRRGQLINICGEKTTEDEMQHVINLLEEKAGCRILNWTTSIETSNMNRRYLILTENEQGKDLTLYSEWIHSQIARTNTRYNDMSAYLSQAKILNQVPGTHAQWRELRIRNGMNASQYKPVHILDTDEKRNFFISRTF